jgi:hypothetical protein
MDVITLIEVVKVIDNKIGETFTLVNPVRKRRRM